MPRKAVKRKSAAKGAVVLPYDHPTRVAYRQQRASENLRVRINAAKAAEVRNAEAVRRAYLDAERSLPSLPDGLEREFDWTPLREAGALGSSPDLDDYVEHDIANCVVLFCPCKPRVVQGEANIKMPLAEFTANLQVESTDG